MKSIVVAAAIGVMAALRVTASAADTTAGVAHVGEVRAFAIGEGNQDAIAQLHREGWLEADGQLLAVRLYQPLYREIGRTWTADGVAEDRFAVPRLRDSLQRAPSSDNPYGVLGPGDLVGSGSTRRRSVRAHPVSYWIFTGEEVGAIAR
jgi:hypothetical protein